MNKVQIFLEGQKILKKIYSNLFDVLLSGFKQVGRFFQMCVAISEYMNFIYTSFLKEKTRISHKLYVNMARISKKSTFEI